MASLQPAATRPRSNGFTLVEVLGAVAVLGISYIMLATATIQGLQLIGESQRRIHASLLADEILAEIEISAEIGQLIEIGYEEREAGPFAVAIETRDMAEFYDAGSIGGDKPKGLMEFLAAEANGPFAPFRNSNWLLGYLREIHISISWQEAANTIEVTRTAYIYDQQAWMEHEQQAEEGQPQGSANRAQATDEASS